MGFQPVRMGRMPMPRSDVVAAHGCQRRGNAARLPIVVQRIRLNRMGRMTTADGQSTKLRDDGGSFAFDLNATITHKSNDDLLTALEEFARQAGYGYFQTRQFDRWAGRRC